MNLNYESTERGWQKVEKKQPKDIMKNFFRYVIRLLGISLMFVGIATALGLIYGFILHTAFTPRYIFDANFAIGVAVILAGIFYMFFPSSMLQKGDKFLDHSTFVERSFKSRKRRQSLAMEILLVGILVIIIPGLIQVWLSAVI